MVTTHQQTGGRSSDLAAVKLAAKICYGNCGLTMEENLDIPHTSDDNAMAAWSATDCQRSRRGGPPSRQGLPSRRYDQYSAKFYTTVCC